MKEGFALVGIIAVVACLFYWLFSALEANDKQQLEGCTNPRFVAVNVDVVNGNSYNTLHLPMLGGAHY